MRAHFLGIDALRQAGHGVGGLRDKNAVSRAQGLAHRVAQRVRGHRRRAEIGFIDGERVRVVARAHPDGDPIAVRVGNTMFALRRCEAEQVLVAPLTSDSDARQPERMRAAIAAAAPSPANVNPSATGRRCAVPARERRA